MLPARNICFLNISTHTPLARRDEIVVHSKPQQEISTHTPLARRDPKVIKRMRPASISTHTPLARRDNHSLTIRL